MRFLDGGHGFVNLSSSAIRCILTQLLVEKGSIDFNLQLLVQAIFHISDLVYSDQRYEKPVFLLQIIPMPSSGFIRIKNASENNLRSVSLDIPRNKLVVVTGVSGSGKSSLVFDVLYREAENRYLGSFSSHTLQFLGKRKWPDVEKIEVLSPAVSVGQKSVWNNPRSTV